MATTLILEKVTPSSNGGFINTWSQAINTPLGIMRSGNEEHRYCTKSRNELSVGMEVEIDLNQWEISESDPFTGKDGKEYTTRWLRVK
jgi:hypothetical protein